MKRSQQLHQALTGQTVSSCQPIDVYFQSVLATPSITQAFDNSNPSMLSIIRTLNITWNFRFFSS